MSSELETLASAACDNRASDAELARLAELLRDDPAARDEYLRYVDIHSALSDEALPAFESDIVDYDVSRQHSSLDSSNERAGNVSMRWFSIAASVAVVFAIAFFALRQPPIQVADDTTPPVATTPIATVLLSEDCRWSGDDLGEGDRLSAGRVELKGGTAVLRFDGGAELVMVGPTAIDLQSAGSVLVHNGDVVVRATDGAEGFVVTTPTSEVVDLGTEFAVKVNRSGTTEVHVLDGEVSYRGLNAADELSKILRAGEGIAIDEKGRPTAVPMNSPRFQEFIKRINPRVRTDLLIAYEGFNYSPGVLPLAESTVGKGWAGPWRKRTDAEGANGQPDTGTNDALQIVHGQMNVTWPVPGGRLGMLQFPSGKSYRVREMRRPIDLGRDGIYYFSLMVRESDLSGRPRQARPQESMRLTFRSEEAYFDESLSFQISSKRTPQIRTGLGVGFASAAESSPDQTTLWIGKIVARKNGEDEVSFRVFAESDELTYAEPAVWHVVSRNLDLSAKLNLVLLTSTGNAPRIVDELRIGPTWRSVTPMLEK